MGQIWVTLQVSKEIYKRHDNIKTSRMRRELMNQ